MEPAQTVLEEMDAVECIAHLIVSAGCLKDEPQDYGSMRLLAAAKLLSEKISPHASDTWKPFFEKLTTEIPEIQRLRQQNPEKYYGYIEQYSAELTKLLLDHEESAESSQ